MENLQIPFRYQFINFLGKGIRKINPNHLHLDANAMCEKAQKKTGLSDFGNPHYREGLLTVLDSLENEAHLNAVGRIVAKFTINNYLIQRLRFVESMKADSHIYETPLTPPLIVTGLARSGTSFLHRMLSVDPVHRALPQWQLMRPFPDASKEDLRQQEMEHSLRFREPLVQGADAIHFTRADTPEECIIALGVTFNSLIFPTLFPLPGYLDWYLKNQDAAQKFIEYRQLLQYFQSEAPEQRLLMKTPAHTGNLAQIKQAIPQAMLIQTHREPATCVSSLCSLGYTFYQSLSEKIDKERIGAQTAALNESWLRRNLAFRETNPGVIYDVYYKDLVADPIGTVKNIYKHFALPWTKEYEKALNDFIYKNPKNKHGKHQYTAADFGLDEEELKERFRFYSEYMGLSKK